MVSPGIKETPRIGRQAQKNADTTLWLGIGILLCGVAAQGCTSWVEGQRPAVANLAARFMHCPPDTISTGPIQPNDTTGAPRMGVRACAGQQLVFEYYGGVDPGYGGSSARWRRTADVETGILRGEPTGPPLPHLRSTQYVCHTVDRAPGHVPSADSQPSTICYVYGSIWNQQLAQRLRISFDFELEPHRPPLTERVVAISEHGYFQEAFIFRQRSTPPRLVVTARYETAGGATVKRALLGQVNRTVNAKFARLHGAQVLGK